MKGIQQCVLLKMCDEVCSVSGCDRAVRARGLCKRHYEYHSRHGILPAKKTTRKAKYRKPEIERFYDRIEKDSETGCWNWIGCVHSTGYGKFQLDSSKVVNAHRYSFELKNGYIDNEKFVCHSCDNRRCVNPEHLWEGTARENNLDCRLKNRAVFPPDQTGELHSQHKLTEKDVIDIRVQFANGVKQAELMRKYNVARNTIHKICTNKTWKHIGVENESL